MSAAANTTLRLPEPAAGAEALTSLTALLASRAGEADRAAALDADSIRAAHASGWLTATVGRALGGAGIGGEHAAQTRGAGAASFIEAFTAMGEGDPSVALVALMTAMQHLAAANGVFWPSDLYERIVADSVPRPVLLNAALAEPALGASSRGGRPATTARRSGGGWIVDGRKSFVTGSEHLAYHAVSVWLPESERTARAIVPGDAVGVEVVRSWDGIGMRASSTHDVRYREVEIPAGHLRPSDGASGSPVIGAMFGLGASAIYLGIARAARDALTAFLNGRVPTALGASLATVERLQTAVGEVSADVLMAEETLRSLARRLDDGAEPSDARIGAAKLVCTRAAISAVDGAVRAAGSHGLSTAAPLERHLRDVLCARSHPPQDDVSLKRLGLAALGGRTPAVQNAAVHLRAPSPGPASSSPDPTSPDPTEEKP